MGNTHFCVVSRWNDTGCDLWTLFLTHYLVKMGLNSHKSVLFNVIEQIMNFPVIYGFPYLFLVHPFKNVGQMGQKWAKIHLSPVSFLCDTSHICFSCSRNQLSLIPPFICQLQSLEVLLAANNKLVSLPEEIGRLEKLMQLVSIVFFYVTFCSQSV